MPDGRPGTTLPVAPWLFGNCVYCGRTIDRASTACVRHGHLLRRDPHHRADDALRDETRDLPTMREEVRRELEAIAKPSP